jgi:hypothetical protein
MGKLVGAFHSLVELGSGDVHSGSGGLHLLADFWVLGAAHRVWVLGLVRSLDYGSGGIVFGLCGTFVDFRVLGVSRRIRVLGAYPLVRVDLWVLGAVHSDSGGIVRN